MTALRDSNGVIVKKGDKVRTPDGDVVRVQGVIPKRREFRMSDCTIVPKNTPLGPELPPAVDQVAFA